MRKTKANVVMPPSPYSTAPAAAQEAGGVSTGVEGGRSGQAHVDSREAGCGITALKIEGRWSIQGMPSGPQCWAQRELDPSADPTFSQLCHSEQKAR